MATELDALFAGLLAAQLMLSSPGADDWSYRQTITSPQGVTQFITDFRDGRTKIVRGRTQSIEAGNVSYRFEHGRWTKLDLRHVVLPRALKKKRARAYVRQSMAFLPDSMAGNLRLRTVVVTVRRAPDQPATPTAPRTVAVRCVFEAKTSRVRVCSTANASIRIDRYNDPANRFPIPAAALHAPNVPLPAEYRPRGG
jgi:hypothetical protein